MRYHSTLRGLPLFVVPVFALALLAGHGAAQFGIVRLQAAAEANADQDQPGLNFGTSPEFNFGKAFESTPTFRVWFLRGHIRFDLPVSTTRPPDRARLRWYQSRSNAAGCLDVTLHRVTAPWNETTLTWNNKPTHDPAVESRTCVGDSFDLGWKSFEATSLVRAWMDATHPNFGMVLRDPNETTAGAARPGYGHGRRSPQVALRPYLELSWGTFPFGSGCGRLGAATLDLDAGEPARGAQFTLSSTRLPRSGALLRFLGRSNTTFAGVPLPLDLTTAGFPGCFLLVSGEILLPGTADVRGNASVTYSVPNDPALVGARLYHQVAGFDTNLALTMSNGFVTTIY